jgi:hypothetical protein
MDGILPVLFGFGLIGVLIATVSFFPASWLGRELRRAYQVQTTGVLGRFTSRDFVRSAVMSFTIAALLVASSVAAFTVSEQKRGTVQLFLEAYFFGFFLLAGVTLLATFQTLARGAQVHRRERRVARAVAARPQLFAALCAVLARYDPMDVHSLQEPREYEYQAGRILLALDNPSTYEDVLQNVRGYFALWFPWADHSPGRFAPLAQEIWNLLQARRDA